VSTVALLIFPACMAFAACSDLLTMRISNKIVLALVAAFVIMAMVINLPLQQFLTHWGVALLVLVATFTMFAMGWIGGGDAKFAAATVLWLGPGLALPYLLVATVMGGGLTLIFLIGRNYMLPQRLMEIGWVERLHNKSNGVPYGIALAAGGMLTYPESVIFLSLAG